jgi:signal transduction histidine kinase
MGDRTLGLSDAPDHRVQFYDTEAGDGTGTWDGDRLSQVFSNLIANAGQHGEPEHPVQVSIDGTEADHVRIAIHNWGAIPATLLPGLFEPLAGQARRRDSSGGLGLGLHIARELAKAHGGSIAVTSDETRGTTFTVTLPREAPTGAGRMETDSDVDTRFAPRRSR